MGCPTITDYWASKNAYCHSDCNRDTKSVETCIDNLAGKTPDQLEATLLARLPHHMGPSGAAEGTALLEGLLLQAGLEGPRP